MTCKPIGIAAVAESLITIPFLHESVLGTQQSLNGPDPIIVPLQSPGHIMVGNLKQSLTPPRPHGTRPRTPTKLDKVVNSATDKE